MSIAAINPTTGERIAEYREMSLDDSTRIIGQVYAAFETWRELPFEERGRVLHEAARLLRARSREYAVLMANELGKPISQGAGEVEKCAWVCDYYAEHAERFLRPELVETDARKSYVSFQPLGPVLAVMPWNFPFWQVFRFAAPALMAGNTALLKHASNVPGCALAIEELLRAAGCPAHVFRTLLVGNKLVEQLLSHPQICAVTLTGSTGAGRAIGRQAGALLKKSVLELGGSDAYVVLEDADLSLAVETCVASRLINGGQSCIAAKRFIVVRAIREEFERRYVERMRQARVGDPLDPATEVGPLARRDLRESLHEQVKRSIAAGARLLLGGELPSGPGAFYPPTVLTNVRPGMPAHDEELFGPVAAIIPVENEEEAIRAANNSLFGLGAAVFTRDIARGERIAAQHLEAGSCFVNAYVKSDPRLPFGGIKESGYGRELSHYGIKEFVNIKTVWIAA